MRQVLLIAFLLQCTYSFAQPRVTVYAGSSTTAGLYRGDGGPATGPFSTTSALLASAQYMAIDSANNLYVTENSADVIRKIDFKTKIISRFAGLAPAANANGVFTPVTTFTFSGDGGLATNASLARPNAIAIDKKRNLLYFVDYRNWRIRKIDLTTNIITTIAGTGIAYTAGNTAAQNGFGGPALNCNVLGGSGSFPIDVDTSGNLYVGSSQLHIVSKIDNQTNNINIIAGSWNIQGYTGNGGLALNAKLTSPYQLTIDQKNNLYVTSFNSSTVGQIAVRKIDLNSGIIDLYTGSTTHPFLASGDGGPVSSATIVSPVCISKDLYGDIYMNDYNTNSIRKVNNTTNIITRIAGSGNNSSLGTSVSPSSNNIIATAANVQTWRQLVMDTYGNLYVCATSQIFKIGLSDSLIVPITPCQASSWSLNVLPNNETNALIPSSSGQVNLDCNIVVSNLTLEPGVTLNTNGKSITANNIYISPGSYIIGNGNVICSNVNFQQRITAQRGWRLFSNPFSTTQTFSSIAANNSIAINTTPNPITGLTDVRTYNTSTNTWNNISAPTTTPNVPFSLFIRGLTSEVSGLTYSNGPTPFNINFSGTLNSLNSNYTVTTEADATKFTLVGNPFPAPIISQSLTARTAQPYYVYTVTQGTTDAEKRTKSGSWAPVLTSSLTTTIPILGVIAWKPAANFTVSSADLSVSGTQITGLFKDLSTIRNIELHIEKNGLFKDKLFVSLDNRASYNGIDKSDLEKFNNDDINIYTISSDNKNLSINSINAFTNPIPLGISSSAGSYTFKVVNNSLNTSEVVYLKDKLMNTQTALTDGSTYDFEVDANSATQGTQRFELSIAKQGLNPGNFKAKILGNSISSNQFILLIEGAENIVSIEVNDINGKLIKTETLSNRLNNIKLNNIAAGLYTVKIVHGNSSITEKLIKL